MQEFDPDDEGWKVSRFSLHIGDGPNRVEANRCEMNDKTIFETHRTFEALASEASLCAA